MLRKSKCSRHKCNRRKGGPTGQLFSIVGVPIILTEDQGSVPCPHVRQLTTVKLQLQGIHTLKGHLNIDIVYIYIQRTKNKNKIQNVLMKKKEAI